MPYVWDEEQHKYTYKDKDKLEEAELPAHIVSDDDEGVVNKAPTMNSPPRRGPTADAPSIHCCDTPCKRYSWVAFFVIGLIVGFSLLIASLKKVPDTEIGLEYNVHSKVLADAAQSGGLFLGPPGFKFVMFPKTFVTADLPEGECVSRDGLRVRFQVSFSYQMPEVWLKPAILMYRDFDKWATVVEEVGVSAIHLTCSLYDTGNFQNQRGVIQQTMLDTLRSKLEGPDGDGASGVYARAQSLQVRNVWLPDEYSAAVAEKQKAAEDIELAKNQRIQERTKAGTALLSAREEARRTTDTANNEANVTLTEAQLQAEEIRFLFQTEGSVLRLAKEILNLSSGGVLSYMANGLYAEVDNLSVETGQPARLSRMADLEVTSGNNAGVGGGGAVGGAT